MRFIAVVDQGTTNTKALLIDELGRVAASFSERVTVSFPRPGWVESDALELWFSSERTLRFCLDAAPRGSVVALGISNQRESVVVWDRATGVPLGPVVSWQCGRGVDRIDKVRASGRVDVDSVAHRTGLPLDAMFSASKAAWLLDNIPHGRSKAEDGEICLGTVDTWLLWNLTNGAVFATDQTNASRTMLMDLVQNQWDPDLCHAFGVPTVALPLIQPSAHTFGSVALRHPGFATDATVAGVAGDSHAAFVGHRAFTTGSVKATFGTGTSVMASTSRRPEQGKLASTIAWSATASVRARTGLSEKVYAVEANIIATGAALEWTASLLGFGSDVGRLEELALSVESTGGVAFVPALAGLGAPHWDSAARGMLCGLTRGSGPAHIARAAFVAVAQQVADVFDVLPISTGVRPSEVRIDGGATRSNLLAQLVADYTSLRVVRSGDEQVAATGAAILAGLTSGVWSSVRDLPEASDRTVFEPSMSRDVLAGERSMWRTAVDRSLSELPVGRVANGPT